MEKMHRIIEVKPEEGYKIWIKFSDGKEGIVYLTVLVGKGVFARWNDKEYFNSVYVDQKTHNIAWLDGIDLCPDVLTP